MFLGSAESRSAPQSQSSMTVTNVDTLAVSSSAANDRAAGAGSVAVVSAGSRSVVTRALVSSPLRLLTPRNHGHGAWVYSSTYGGGLVGGDAVRLDVHVGRAATMLLATQAATKVYRSPLGTIADLDAIVEDDGLLVVAPEPVICFAGAGYRQRQRFDLDDRASLVYLDWFSSGRHASGERWQFDRYESRVEIRRAGRLIVVDGLTLSSEHGSIASRMGRFDVFLTAAIVGAAVAPYAADVLARVSALPVAAHAPLLSGASPIADEGCLLRMAGTSVEDVGRAARALLAFVPPLLGDDPWARRW
jgi:urease accessory protein